MECYNVPKDEGYKVVNSYVLVKQNTNSGYGNSKQTISLPIYQEERNEQPTTNRRSRCPRGAILNRVGSCCGDKCTRACAIEV